MSSRLVHVGKITADSEILSGFGENRRRQRSLVAVWKSFAKSINGFGEGWDRTYSTDDGHEMRSSLVSICYKDRYPKINIQRRSVVRALPPLSLVCAIPNMIRSIGHDKRVNLLQTCLISGEILLPYRCVLHEFHASFTCSYMRSQSGSYAEFIHLPVTNHREWKNICSMKK